jgi:hypothetical protein
VYAPLGQFTTVVEATKSNRENPPLSLSFSLPLLFLFSLPLLLSFQLPTVFFCFCFSLFFFLTVLLIYSFTLNVERRLMTRTVPAAKNPIGQVLTFAFIHGDVASRSMTR